MYKYTCFMVALFMINYLSAQLTDLARVEYTYFPQRESDNSFRRFRALANFPISVNDKGSYLVPGLEYRNVNFKYRDMESFDTRELERFSSFEVRLGYTFKLNKNWRFAAQSGVIIASNFENSGIHPQDVLYTGSLYIIKDRTKNTSTPWRLILGLQYSTTWGRPFPLPFINYYKRFDPSWSFVLGVPKSNIKYYFNEKNILQSFVTLDGFYANIQNNRMFLSPENPEIERTANNISMTIALAGIGYERILTDHLLFYTYTGFTIWNDIRLRNKKHEDVLTINDKNSLYIRGGLKVKL